jgi:hypothetical protein
MQSTSNYSLQPLGPRQLNKLPQHKIFLAPPVAIERILAAARILGYVGGCAYKCYYK